jgi:hypothetical protein
MARPPVTEPNRAADYDDRGVRAMHAVLIELGRILGPYRDAIVVVGGAVLPGDVDSVSPTGNCPRATLRCRLLEQVASSMLEPDAGPTRQSGSQRGAGQQCPANFPPAFSRSKLARVCHHYGRRIRGVRSNACLPTHEGNIPCH